MLIMNLLYTSIFYLSIFNPYSSEPLKCVLSDDASVAYSRASTKECKDLIQDAACRLQLQSAPGHDKLTNILYKLNSERTCPLRNNMKSTVTGCLSPSDIQYFVSSNQSLVVDVDNETDKSQSCIDKCLARAHSKYTAVAKDRPHCVCVKKLNSTTLTPCTDQSYVLYPTGLIEIDKSEPKKKRKERSNQEIMSEFDQQASLPRIVFLLTLNGRSVRQVFRLIKSTYHDHHFYYFHIDERMTFLRREVKRMIEKVNKTNMYMPDWSMSTMWGGANLLHMHLRVITELLDRRTVWPWDFVLNLSESDFPIKTIQELTLYLHEHRRMNFLRFFKREYEDFFKSQGLEYLFTQCDGRMWKIGKRQIPAGIQIEGGSDWFCLSHEFCDYVVHSRDEFLTNLKSFFNYTLLPSETFFHTALVNSRFCNSTVINSHLKYINWKRDRGCTCQYKSIVDWCGCSPNYITRQDTTAIKNLNSKHLFFARKFDPLFNLDMINLVDQSIFGIYSADFKSLNSYWHNLYHHTDKPAQSDTRMIQLFKQFAPISAKGCLKNIDAINHYTLDYSRIVATLNDAVNAGSSLTHVRRVDGFFQANKFKGFVLDLSYKDTELKTRLEFQALFRLREPRELTKLYNVQDTELSRQRDLILNSMIRLEVSTDYDQKERRFNNYAQIIDQRSNPTLLIQFDPLPQPIQFDIAWLDKNNSSFRTKHVSLNQSESVQTVVTSMLRSSSKIEHGEWTVSLSVSSNTSQSVILTRRFLVLPTSFNSNTCPIELMWYLDSTCIQSHLNLASNSSLRLFDHILPLCKSSYWSTNYPDPKSDIDINFGIDLNSRI